jgi:hypothetical protein
LRGGFFLWFLSFSWIKKKNINLELACTALLALVQIEDPTGKIDNYHITEIITEIIKAHSVSSSVWYVFTLVLFQ